ncbi:hypothetical protein LMH87_006694 [Akanthomyces muscarius]|uniref:Uncharacterized protein n=1 Tax=Akanthomyces muscarius TaxID=2231603 RepID=A0A9W8QRN2_AKAMU|nr:hypothetical protein LMH87_006694 [Akanthomyces muscarius]KAJ4165047.1 hypothetical protein LMH87_006694 [Akanthomyces muscarius]
MPTGTCYTKPISLRACEIFSKDSAVPGEISTGFTVTHHQNFLLAAALDCAALSKIPPTPLRHPQIMNKTPPSKQIWNPAFKQI